MGRDVPGSNRLQVARHIIVSSGFAENAAASIERI
jgi:hypothetical protein